MKTQIEQVAAAVLPRGIQGEGLQLISKHIGKNSGRPLKLVKAAAGTVGWGYWQQLKASSNQYLRGLQALVIFSCYAAAPHDAGLIALGAIMIAIAFRDAYTHNEKAPEAFQYYLDSAGDAVVASLSLICSQILAGRIEPAMALPAQLMYRGLFVCMPLLAMLQMVFRHPPVGAPSFKGSGWSAEQVYRRIWVLNALWTLLFWGVLAQTVTDRRNYFPDFLRGMLPVVTFATWVAIQRVALRNRVRIETLMTLIRKDEVFRKADSLPQGLKKGEQMYRWHVALQALIFFQMGLALLGAVEPFLSGKPLSDSVFPAFGAVLGFVVSGVTWQYVKQSNQAAGRALVQIARSV